LIESLGFVTAVQGILKSTPKIFCLATFLSLSTIEYLSEDFSAQGPLGLNPPLNQSGDQPTSEKSPLKNKNVDICLFVCLFSEMP